MNSTNNTKKMYIAGMGMVTPVGGNVAMTAAMISANISAYKSSYFERAQGEKITMAQVPGEMIAEFAGEIDEGSCFNPRHDRVIRMAILALQLTMPLQLPSPKFHCPLPASRASKLSSALNERIKTASKRVPFLL